MATFRRKKIRLPSTQYLGRRIYFLTLCCERRRPTFSAESQARWIIECLRDESQRCYFAVHAFCVMPDHVHLVVEGTDPTSDLLKFVKGFKQKTAHTYKERCHQSLWQSRYYDHILRPTDGRDPVMWYVWMNPVRKSLCARPEDYPFSGSFTIEWKSMVRPTEAWAPVWRKKDLPA